MKARTGLIFTVMCVAMATAVQAQRGRADNRLSAERILQMRERLELTTEQIEQLNTLRKAELARRLNELTQSMTLRSDLAAGETTREAVREQAQAARDSVRSARDAYREQITQILTDDQAAMVRTRAARARGPRGRAVRDGRGRGRNGRGIRAERQRGPRFQRGRPGSRRNDGDPSSDSPGSGSPAGN